MIDALLAIPCAALPKRYWQSFDLPMASMAPVSSWVTMLLGFVIGIPGYFAYLERLRGAKGVSILEISTAQLEQRLPETAEVSAIPSVLSMTAPAQFLLNRRVGGIERRGFRHCCGAAQAGLDEGHVGDYA
ncbi:MAG: hypothetical protein K2Y23_21185 [Cyanobacteria bacterium]|nr:hypothetical protein [Cyanobacteriota bacterium]